MMNMAWNLYVSRNVVSRSTGGTKSKQYPTESQDYHDVQGPCSTIVSIKDKFFKLVSH
jgi:hypothetical protein